MVHSHITYCPIIWLANQPQKNIKTISNIQKRALRALFSTNYNSHTQLLFDISGIEKVENICSKERIWTMYQYKMGKLPKAISNLIESSLNTNPARTLRSSSTSLNLKSKTFPGDLIYGLINTWNTTTCKVKQNTYSDKTCKDIIKKHLATQSKAEPCAPICQNCINTESLYRHLKYKSNKLQKKKSVKT